MAEMKPTQINALRLSDGSVMRHGQIIKSVGAHNRTSELSATPGYSDPLASPAAKRTVDSIPLASGMRNRITEHNLAFEGGRRPLDDEPMAKGFLDGRQSPVHPAMGSATPEHRGRDVPGQASAILNSAVLKSK
jgi:hypothetical protein